MATGKFTATYEELFDDPATVSVVYGHLRQELEARKSNCKYDTDIRYLSAVQALFDNCAKLAWLDDPHLSSFTQSPSILVFTETIGVIRWRGPRLRVWTAAGGKHASGQKVLGVCMSPDADTLRAVIESLREGDRKEIEQCYFEDYLATCGRPLEIATLQP